MAGNIFPPTFFGMRGTGDWVTNQLPEDWNETILYLFPNGDAPLTAMMSKMGTEPINSVKTHWWTQGLPIQAATLTNIYTDSTLGTAYVSGGTSGSHVYVKLPTETDVDHFRVGHQVTVRVAADLAGDVVTKCVERTKNGASSYLKLRLLEADDNGSSTTMADATRVLVSGNMNAEGASMPDTIVYDPTEWYNNTQIFRTPLEITGTAIATELRTNPQAYPKAQKECLKTHSMEREKAFWFSVPSSTVNSDNGKPERTMMGIIPAIRGTYDGHGGPAGTVGNYVTDSDYSGKSWLSGGEAWLNTQLETIFLYGNVNKMAFVGNSTLMAIQKLVQNNGDFMWGPDTTIYGIKVREWITPLGSIALMTHPLFNYEVTMRKVMVIVEPENIKRSPLMTRDTNFISETIGKTNSGYTRRDGIKEEYLTEETLKLYHPIGWAFLEGFGDDNTA